MSNLLTGGKVLIVEDEDIIAEAVKVALEDAGSLAEATSDADKAVAILELNRARDLVGLVTDINLGSKRNGWEIAARGRELNPALAVVYVSGDSVADWPAHGVPNSTVLQKPFATSQVVVAISALLNRTDLDG